MLWEGIQWFNWFTIPQHCPINRWPCTDKKIWTGKEQFFCIYWLYYQISVMEISFMIHNDSLDADSSVLTPHHAHALLYLFFHFSFLTLFFDLLRSRMALNLGNSCSFDAYIAHTKHEITLWVREPLLDSAITRHQWYLPVWADHMIISMLMRSHCPSSFIPW